MDSRPYVSLVLILVGLLLLGSGITGMVTVSQSCCFGPECAAENLCEATQPRTQEPASFSGSGRAALGVLFLLAGIVWLGRGR